MAHDMSELLSAASLLLAVAGVLYGLWYPEMSNALAIRPSPHPEDNRARARQVSVAIRGRAIPLFLVAGSIALVFGHDAFLVATESFSAATNGAFDYSAASTAFVLVVCLSAGLAAHSFVMLMKLRNLSRRLSGNDARK